MVDLSFIENDLIRFAVMVIGSFVLATVVQFILNTYVKRITEKTKTDFDDIVLGIISKPVYWIILFVGLDISLKFQPLVVPYVTTVDAIFTIIFTFIGASLISNLLSFLVGRWLHVNQRFAKTPELVSKMITVVVYIVAILMVLAYFKVEISPIIATLGIGGLAVGLALQNTLSNFFAGLHILSDRPVNVGDYIELENAEIAGTVEDISWRSTRIKTNRNTIIIIPNAKLAESTIINASFPTRDINLFVELGVSYNSNLKEVEKTTLEVAKMIQETVPGAIKGFEPLVRFHQFADSNINFRVIMMVDKFEDKSPVRHEFIKALKERYDKEGIEISYPVRKIINSR